MQKLVNFHAGPLPEKLYLSRVVKIFFIDAFVMIMFFPRMTSAVVISLVEGKISSFGGQCVHTS